VRIWLVLFIILGSFSAQAKELDNINTFAKTIEAKLTVGAPKDVVERFLTDSLVQFSFDKYQSRYQAVASKETTECINRSFLLWLFYDCAIQIYLNVDKNGNYSGYQLEQIYSGL
tara:strand:- start:1350 stop:1694 length:345 start_codon:yes stop_codon:yes gene_type:complete